MNEKKKASVGKTQTTRPHCDKGKLTTTITIGGVESNKAEVVCEHDAQDSIATQGGLY